jgi:hypothetical protein
VSRNPGLKNMTPEQFRELRDLIEPKMTELLQAL